MSARTNAMAAGGAIGNIVHGRAPHVIRYLARVDEHLLDLPSDTARRGFLGDEIAKWRRRYIDFQVAVDTGYSDPGTVTAWDYHDTLGELDKRLLRYPRVAA